jgi:hypothetical protein
MAVLTLADHEQFLRDGYVLLRGAVPQDLLEPAVAVLEAERTGERRPHEPEVLACVNDTVVSAAAELIGSDLTPELTQVMYRPRHYDPAGSSTHGVHIDSHYPTIVPETWSLGGFVFLTAVPPGGGAFWIAPGSPLGYRRTIVDSPSRVYDFLRGQETKLIEVLAEPGDVVLFQFLMAHSGSANRTNPQCRHALDFRFGTRERLGAVQRPIPAMSTLEKANSTAALLPRQCPNLAGAVRPSLDGVDDLSHAVLRHEGVTHRWSVAKADPLIVRHASSADLRSWHHHAPLEPAGTGAVRSLTLSYYQGLVTLGVAGHDGSVVLTSEDLQSWRQVATSPARAISAFWASKYTMDDATRGASAYVLFEAEGSQLLWRSGPSWESLGSSAGLAASHVAGASIDDVLVAPLLSDDRFGLIVDAGGRPWASSASDPAHFPALTPLAHDCPTPPRAVRLYERSVDYWLVTYLREEAGQLTPFWGSLDWSGGRPELREIVEQGHLTCALVQVGLA